MTEGGRNDGGVGMVEGWAWRRSVGWLGCRRRVRAVRVELSERGLSGLGAWGRRRGGRPRGGRPPSVPTGHLPPRKRGERGREGRRGGGAARGERGWGMGERGARGEGSGGRGRAARGGRRGVRGGAGGGSGERGEGSGSLEVSGGAAGTCETFAPMIWSSGVSLGRSGFGGACVSCESDGMSGSTASGG